MTTVEQWVDVHGHFLPPMGEDERLRRREAMRAEDFLVTDPPRWDPRSTLDHLDRAGVAMQLLSYIPKDVAALREANDYGAEVVAEHPARFGLLAALPTDDPDAAMGEMVRSGSADGYAVTTTYNGVDLADPRLEPVWEDVQERDATVFVHPDAYAPAVGGLPRPLVEVAFDTARSVVAMLYAGVFRRHPDLRLVLAHAGGALPALSGRLALLGAEDWVPNPHGITREEIREQLGRLHLDTAATGADSHLAAAVAMVPRDHLVYGTDCGVPCSTEATMDANAAALQDSGVLTAEEVRALGRRALDLFPNAARRLT